MLLFSKKEVESPIGRHGRMLPCPFCKASQEEVGIPVSSSRFSASEMGLGPAQGTDSLTRCESKPNVVTNLLCDSVRGFPPWEPQSPIPMAQRQTPKGLLLTGLGDSSWLERKSQ